MATPGYDLNLTLAQIFWACENPTPGQVTEAMAVARKVTHKKAGEPPYAIERFMLSMGEARGQRSLALSLFDRAEGLLECLANGWQTPEPPPLGVYDHFKGGIYLAQGYSSWASGNGEPVVEYVSLLHGTKHIRLVSQWCEVVLWPDSKYRSRFVRRGDSLNWPEPAFKTPSPTVTVA